MTPAEWRRLVNAKAAELTQAEARVAVEKAALSKLERLQATLASAQDLAQRVAQEVQGKAHAHIAAVVTRCLRTVYDDPYEFLIHFKRKRGRTEARLVFKRDGEEVDPLTASGGGVVDVAAFALRMACLVLSSPKLRPFLALDEPFCFVRPPQTERVRVLVETLAEEMGVQIVMVTPGDQLRSGLVVDLGES